MFKIGTAKRWVPCMVLVLGSLMELSAPAQGQQTWLNASWGFRNPITVANPGGTTLSNFQVRVTLNSSFGFANAKSDGSDVRVTSSDGVTAIPFWIESWNAGTQTASIWVNVPSIPAGGTTVYLYYGNPSATSTSSGNTTFEFFDDFENQSPKGYYNLISPTTTMVTDQAWETFAPHTLSVIKMNSGGHTYWGYYALQFGCGGVGLAYSEDLVHWTKSTTNPLFSNGRWPVVTKAGNVFYMIYTKDYCGTSYNVLATSTDGLTWTDLKTLVQPQSGLRNQGAWLLLNPNDGLYYMYWYRGDDTTTWNIMVRSSATIEGLDNTATEQTIMHTTQTLAMTSVIYQDNTYLMATEAFNSNGDWATYVYGSTTSPTSGFQLLQGNAALDNGAACLFQYVIDTTLHGYYCQYTNAIWTVEHRSANLAIPRPISFDPLKWNQAGGSWQVAQDTQQDGSVGGVLKGTLNQFDQMLYSKYSGGDYVAEVYGKQLSGPEWSLGTRATNAANLYTANLFNGAGTTNLYEFKWVNSTGPDATQIGQAAVGPVNLNTWYKLAVKVHGSSIDVYKDGIMQLQVTDTRFPTGGVAVSGEPGTNAEWNNMLVRKFAATDPTSVVGLQQSSSITLPVASVTLNPISVTGGTSSTGTVTLTTAAPTGGVIVTLSSNNAAATVSPTVIVAAGATSANFNVSTSAVSALVSVTITATSTDSKTATLTVNPPVLSTVSLSPSSVTGGTSSTGTVTLNGIAPTLGALVTLSSNNGAATVPASVTVAAGATTATFNVATSAVSAITTPTITATFGVAKTASLTVNPPVLSTVSLSPSSVIGGTSSTGTVTLNGIAPTLGALVTLSSNNGAATVPASVTVAAGATTATFNVATSAVSAITTPTITATFGVAKTASLTVNPPVLSTVSLSPSSVTGGTSSTGTVTLNGIAPTLGAVVTLSSNNAAATVPANVTVAAGATAATFDVGTIAVSAITTPMITATLGVVKTATLTVNPVATTVSSVTLNPTSVVGGVANSTATVTLNGVAPAGGQAVTLTSSNLVAATVPASITVSAGATGATFTVTSNSVPSATTSTITATFNGSANATLSVNPLIVSSLSLNPITVTGGVTNSTATVTLNSPAPAGGVSVGLSSNNPSAATVPASVTVAGGLSTATFTVTSQVVVAQSTAVITATLNGSATATLTVNAIPPLNSTRVNVGGPAYTDSLGQSWVADTGFTGGSTFTITNAITNTNDQTLYKTVRYGAFTYSLPAPVGNYAVTLKFAEVYWTAAGQRLFNVAINGTTVLTNFDVFSSAGATYKAVDRTFNVTSTGTITIAFTRGPADDAMVNAILIAPAGVSVQINPTSASLLANQTQQFSASVTGSSNTAVTWSMNPAVGTLDTNGLYTAPSSIATQQAVTVTATSVADTAQKASATVTLNPPATLSSVSVSPASVVGGSSSTGTVTLTAPAPVGGAVVTLGSSNTSVANVQPSVTIGVGLTTATFPVTTSPVTGSTPVTISGDYGGPKTTVLTVTNVNPIRVDSGGPAYTDTLGQPWAADTGFTGGSTFTITNAITNTTDQALYKTVRYGAFSYSFAAPAGTYSVTLKFAEVYWTAAGQRLFNVAINGTPVLTNFDIFAAAGATYRAVDRTFTVTSTGTITITFTRGSADDAMVNAIQISQ